MQTTNVTDGQTDRAAIAIVCIWQCMLNTQINCSRTLLSAESHLWSSVSSSVDRAFERNSSNFGYAKSAISDRTFCKYADTKHSRKKLTLECQTRHRAYNFNTFSDVIVLATQWTTYLTGFEFIWSPNIPKTGLPLNFKNNIPRLCSALFPDPPEAQVLVLCNFYSAAPPLHWLLSITILL